MASEPAPDPSEQSSAICPRHGLRYDPRLSTGCVRCRRTRDEASSPYAGPLGVALVAVGLVALAIPLRTSIKAYFSAPATSALELPPGAPPEHRHCLSAEGTTNALGTASKDCEKACDSGWGASCRRLAGICSPDASLPPGEACAPGPLALLERACKRQDPVACTLLSEQNKASILWKACDSGLGPPCAELAPLCDPKRTALSEGAPTTAWAFFAHPSLRAACSGGPARLFEQGCARGDWASCENPLARSKMPPAKLRELLERACDRADAGACRRLAAQVNESDPGLANALLAYAKELESCTGDGCAQVRRWRDRLSEERPRAEQQGTSTSEEACLQQAIVASCWEAAEAYATGEGAKADNKRANELYARARTLLKEGCGKEGGDCASPDTLKALESCEQGDGSACFSVVNAQAGGASNLTGALFRRGIRLLRADCEQRKGTACWTLAEFHGKGTLPGGESAQIELYRKGCDGRNGLSCNELASRTAEGRGVPKEQLGSERLFRKAVDLLPAECESGSKTACNALADILSAGKAVPRDEAKAATYRAKGAATPPASSR